MQIDVHRVHAEIARTDLARDGVEVRAVAIEIGACLVKRRRNLGDLGLEQTAGVRVRQHHRRDVWPELRAHGLRADGPVLARLDRAHGKAEKRRRRRVRAVGRFGNEHLPPGRRLAARFDRGADRHHAAHLAMRARLGRERDRVHAGQFDQPAAQLGHKIERALHRLFRLQRMNVREAWEPRHLLVQARIMLHGARAEREDAGVDGVVFLRKAHIVADRLRLRKARQADRLAPLQAAQPRLGLLRFVEIDPARLGRADFEDQRLLNRKAAVAREGVNFARWLRMVQRKVFRHLNHEAPH